MVLTEGGEAREDMPGRRTRARARVGGMMVCVSVMVGCFAGCCVSWSWDLGILLSLRCLRPLDEADEEVIVWVGFGEGGVVGNWKERLLVLRMVSVAREYRYLFLAFWNNVVILNQECWSST